MMSKVKIVFGKEESHKFLSGEKLSKEEQQSNVKTYIFQTEEEKNAFCKGVEESIGWTECHIEDSCINNYQTQVIQAQINLLWHIRETHEKNLTTNQVSWIDDDITYVEIKYLNEQNDSTRADEVREEEPKTISFLSAIDLLTVRLHNTISYLGDIDDPDQST